MTLLIVAFHSQPLHALTPPCRREEAKLCLMLEHREAELREAMKLCHSLTTLLHALRVKLEGVRKKGETFYLGLGLKGPADVLGPLIWPTAGSGLHFCAPERRSWAGPQGRTEAPLHG